MPISFDQIPVDLRTPGAFVEIDNSAAVRGLPGMPSHILVIGQRLAAGTVAAGVPTQVLTEAAAETYAGRGSMAIHTSGAIGSLTRSETARSTMRSA